jgi:hypothetical protein
MALGEEDKKRINAGSGLMWPIVIVAALMSGFLVSIILDGFLLLFGFWIPFPALIISGVAGLVAAIVALRISKKRIEKEYLRSVAVRTKQTIDMPAGNTPTPPKKIQCEQPETLGTIALLLPLCGAGYAWFNLQGTTVIGSFFDNTFNVTLGVVLIGTALLIAIEAGNVGAGSSNDLRKGTEGTANPRRREGPVAWFFVVALLWIIGFPWWMYRRSQYGLKNYALVAIVIALIYTGVMVVLGMAIQDAQQSMIRGLQNFSGY